MDDPDALGVELASVHTLPVKRHDTNHERVLTEVHYTPCYHQRFLIDPTLAEVTCADCKEKIDPIHALRQLARKENRYHELHARYHDELRRLAERSRTKCRHCGKMTPISEK
jgi:hypothetical protein